MNNQIETNKRLLKLYPVAVLRKEFGIKATGQEHVIQDIVSTNTYNTIIDFANANFDITKQHIYLFEANKNINISFNVIDLHNPITMNKVLNGKNTATFFVPTSFTVFETIKNQTSKLDFLWPIRIQYLYNKQTKKYIFYLKVTVLEREISAYYPNKVFVTNRSLEEKDIVKSILENFTANNITINKIDLNKGVKELSEKDIIDFPQAKYRKSISITTETMDENYMIKRDNPSVYKLMLQSPLEKTICVFQSKQKDEVDYFRVEPAEGKISFTTYSPTIDAVDKVLALILDNNF